MAFMKKTYCNSLGFLDDLTTCTIFDTLSTPRSVAVLGAVTSMLAGLPREVIGGDLPKLLPVLVQSLAECAKGSATGAGAAAASQTTPAAAASEPPCFPPGPIAGLHAATVTVMIDAATAPRCESALAVVLDTAEADVAALSSYVDELVAPLRILAVSTGSVRVRVMAVQCIHAFAELRAHVIAPHCRDILATMRSAVSDRKRVVRQAAAACANRYSVL
jgi:hypothetical protein